MCPMKNFFLLLIFIFIGVTVGIGTVLASPLADHEDSILFKGQGREISAKVTELRPDYITAIISKDDVTSIISMEDKEGYLDKLFFGSEKVNCKIKSMDMEKNIMVVEIPRKEIASVSVFLRKEHGVRVPSLSNADDVPPDSKQGSPKTGGEPGGYSSLQGLKSELKKELKEEMIAEKRNEDRVLMEQNTGRVEGKIIHGGEPLPNCKVKLVLMVKKGMPLFSGYSSKDAPEFETETDEEGRYVFQGVSAGDYKIYWKPLLQDSWIRRMKVEPDVFVVAGKTCYPKDINTARFTVN